MNMQLALLDDPLDVAFVEWSRANRDVIDVFKRLARTWHRQGHDRCSIGMLTERVRWEYGMRAVDTDDAGVAINNNHRSRLARLILNECPDLPADFFHLRTLASERP